MPTSSYMYGNHHVFITSCNTPWGFSFFPSSRGCSWVAHLHNSPTHANHVCLQTFWSRRVRMRWLLCAPLYLGHEIASDSPRTQNCAGLAAQRPWRGTAAEHDKRSIHKDHNHVSILWRPPVQVNPGIHPCLQLWICHSTEIDQLESVASATGLCLPLGCMEDN